MVVILFPHYIARGTRDASSLFNDNISEVGSLALVYSLEQNTPIDNALERGRLPWGDSMESARSNAPIPQALRVYLRHAIMAVIAFPNTLRNVDAFPAVSL